ncbi:MAG: septum formation initiator family protein [Bacteroidota bacterium]
MEWKKLKNTKAFKFFSNTYVLVLTIFVIWMVFFDTNSSLIHHELQQEILKLEQQKAFLKKEIAKDKKMLKDLQNPKALEKYARERYYMKKDDEEVFLIGHEDSINVKQNR